MDNSRRSENSEDSPPPSPERFTPTDLKTKHRDIWDKLLKLRPTLRILEELDSVLSDISEVGLQWMQNSQTPAGKLVRCHYLIPVASAKAPKDRTAKEKEAMEFYRNLKGIMYMLESRDAN
jgi:hypothetical protein